eukprot:165573-Amphidinium_carterae.1
MAAHALARSEICVEKPSVLLQYAARCMSSFTMASGSAWQHKTWPEQDLQRIRDGNNVLKHCNLQRLLSYLHLLVLCLSNWSRPPKHHSNSAVLSSAVCCMPSLPMAAIVGRGHCQ